MIVPSRLNSMTACDLPIAAIWPWKSAFRSLASVTSVAYLTTLNGLPFGVEDRVVGGLDPDLLPPLPMRLYSPRRTRRGPAWPRITVLALVRDASSTNMRGACP